jgi:xanthine dehydrogenase molybdopterin-binding subunit B
MGPRFTCGGRRCSKRSQRSSEAGDELRSQVPSERWAERFAEETVAGCAVATKHGADLARARIDSSDFWNRGPRRLFEAALDITIDDHDGRLRAVAESAGLAETDVARMVDDRAVMFDINGSFAARVRDASLRRQVLQLCADVFNAVGGGARLDEIRPRLLELDQLAC